jgi:hypothetical protein
MSLDLEALSATAGGRYRLCVALVVLTVVGDEVEAEMIRGFLRANGIECSLRTTDLS